MSLIRFLTIYGFQLGVGGTFLLFMAVQMLRKSRRRVNVNAALFFVSVLAALVLNAIYAGISVEPLSGVVRFLHIFSYYFFGVGQVFLLTLNLTLLRGESFGVKRQAGVSIVYLLLLSLLFFVGMSGGVRIGPDTEWNPEWSLPFFTLALVLYLPPLSIPGLVTSLAVLLKLSSRSFRRRWGFFVAGLLMYLSMCTGIAVTNFLADPDIRGIWAFFVLALTATANFSVYYALRSRLA
jgi:hypothetical protein